MQSPKVERRAQRIPERAQPSHSLTHSTSQNYARLNASRWFVGCGLNPGSGALTSTSCLVLPNALPTSRSPASAPSHPAAHPAPTCDRTARCAHRPACVAQASLHLRMTCDEPSDGVSAGKPSAQPEAAPVRMQQDNGRLHTLPSHGGCACHTCRFLADQQHASSHRRDTGPALVAG